MDISVLAGNNRIKELIARQREGLFHACLLSGCAGSGRHTAARLLAAAMLCTCGERERRPCGTCSACRKVEAGIHPDVITVAGKSAAKPIAVDQVRRLRSDAYIRPNEGERKVYILEEADRMNSPAQNAMLKLLEEGPGYAAFLLLAENPDGLLQTVRSRCENLPLAPVPPRECAGYLAARFPERPAEDIRRAALDCQGVLGRAVEALGGGEERSRARRALAEQLCAAMEQADERKLFRASMAVEKQDREEIPLLLDELERLLGSRAAGGGDRRRALRAAELVRTLREAARANVNPGQLAGWLCAGMFVEERTAKRRSAESDKGARL